MRELAFVNGIVCGIAEASVPVEDRGFQFADGVYEVVRCYRGAPFALEPHLDRLERSSREIELPLAEPRDRIRAIVEELLRESGVDEGVLYIQATRGPAPRGHAFPASPHPTLVMTIRRVEVRPAEPESSGVRVVTARDERWLRCDVKAIGLLPNVLAKQRARRAGADEAVFVRDGGNVTEGASSNVFAVRGGAVHTAPEGPLILSGITRSIVLRLARSNGIPVREEFFTAEFLRSADEAFITSTTAEVAPVTEIDGHPVGDGTPGPVTRALMRLYSAEVARCAGRAQSSR